MASKRRRLIIALKPHELITKVFEEDKRIADELETRIDYQLKSHYSGGSICIPLGMTNLSIRVKNELVYRYRNAGWQNVKVEYDSTDHEDRWYYEIKMSYETPNEIPHD